MKKALIALVILVLVGVSVKSCMAILPKRDMKPVDYDLGLTYEKAKLQDKPIITVFYANWCTYCVRFMPKLDTVRNIYKDRFNVVLVDAENPENKDLVKEYRISGFPTVYIIDPVFDNRVHIDSSYLDSVASLNSEVGRYENMRKLIKKGNQCK